MQRIRNENAIALYPHLADWRSLGGIDWVSARGTIVGRCRAEVTLI
jgi:hypothetical protein